MTVEPRERVVGLLETYHKRMNQIALLHYELDHPSSITSEEMIEAMSFCQGDSDIRRKEHISNKTLYIALNYQEQADRINSESREETVSRLVELEREQEKLAYYISLLDDKQAMVIRRFYFEGHAWREIAQELHVVTRTVHKIKNHALDRLAAMYAYAEGTSI